MGQRLISRSDSLCLNNKGIAPHIHFTTRVDHHPWLIFGSLFQVFSASGKDHEEGGEGCTGWGRTWGRVKLWSDHGGQVLELEEMEMLGKGWITFFPRPPGLPAKSTEEELRHQRQHQKLVEEARRKEQEDNRFGEFDDGQVGKNILYNWFWWGKIVSKLTMKMSRERARRAADQRKAEDDLSSLTSYWTNTVLTGDPLVSIQQIKLSILKLATVFN